MGMVRSLRGAQKLKVNRSADGHVDGHLHCAVYLEFGKQRLEFEDSLPGVPVSYVLNPQQGSFLADEVQRLMRVGIGFWLQIELRLDRVVDCRRLANGDEWSVLFRLPLQSEDDCVLHVVVGPTSMESVAVAMALEVVACWVEGLDKRPLDDDFADLFTELDLVGAPRLSCGLALVRQTKRT